MDYGVDYNTPTPPCLAVTVVINTVHTAMIHRE